MPGFSLSIGAGFSQEQGPDRFSGTHYEVRRFTLPKFERDKVFADTPRFMLVLEGVVLNKSKLIQPGISWEESLIQLYLRDGDTFFAAFRGAFSGLLWDKERDRWIIFTDQVGYKHIYYSQPEGQLHLSSELGDLYQTLKDRRLACSLDEGGAYMLLSYGYMLGDATLSQEVRRLLGGEYLVWQSGRLERRSYYQLPDPDDQVLSEMEAIEQLDRLFRENIRAQFEKDLEYGYRHVVGLSGGLDSRMTTWVAHEMGYTQQLNVTFSQSGYWDETIAKAIASGLQHEWLFKSLDHGLFLTNLEEVTQITGGQVLFFNLAHGHSLWQLLNFDQLGIVHTGQVGGIIKGYYAAREKTLGGGAYSKSLLHKVGREHLAPYAYEREFLLKNRQFNATLYGDLSAQQFTESLSPYLSAELIAFGFNSRLFPKKDELMIKWILQKYPLAGNYVWETTGARLNEPHVTIRGRRVPLRQIPAKVMSLLYRPRGGRHTGFHMNPLEYWHQHNTTLTDFQETYFRDYISGLDAYAELQRDARRLFHQGSALERNQVLSLLAAVKAFF